MCIRDRSYNGSQVLKASATFSFDRYVCGESTSLARDLKRAYNEVFTRGNNQRDGISTDLNTLNQGIYPVPSEGQRSLVEKTTSGRIGQVTNAAGQSLNGAGRIIST